MKNVFAVFKREFKAYFDSPVAYVFLVAFLALVGFLTFNCADFYERREADLMPFFQWHPWVYLLLVPAATMGLWADERRNGTAELLLTLPITLTEALVGKFLAAWAFLGIGLALTFPIAVTVGYLGSPDWGVVICGYLGSFLLAGASCAVGVFSSSVSKSSVVGFVVSLVVLLMLLIIGFTPVIGAVAAWGVPTSVTDAVAACSLFSHFTSIQRGVVDLVDVVYYLGVIVVMLAAAKTVTDGRRGGWMSLAGLAIVAVIVVAADLIVASVHARVDMTENRLYTLSDGSRRILAELESDVVVKYYVSSSAAEMPVELKTYATRVGDLLDEYERASGGRLTVEKYDPKPDSDEEEWAQRYGVKPIPVNAAGAALYLGVVAVCGDRDEALGVVLPQTQATLEYDLTRLITRVSWPERPTIGVMTSIDGVLGGGMDPMMMQMGRRPPQGWIVFSELAKDYDVVPVATDVETIDPKVKTLVVLHARDLADKTLYAIDQFVLRGGKLVACVDPFSLAEMRTSQGQQQMAGVGGDGPSTLGKLFEAWGVGFDSSAIACDLSAATELNAGQGGVVTHPAFLSLGEKNLVKDDVLVQGIAKLLMPFAGSFTFSKKEMDLKFQPVIKTDGESSFENDKMSCLYGDGSGRLPDGRERTLVARLSGTFKTAYPNGPDGTNDVSKAFKEGKSAAILFADTDFLSDDACVRMLRGPGFVIPQFVSENIALFSNVIEQFAGREELIGIRTRGNLERPFTVVNDLETEARRRFQQQQEDLQKKFTEARQRYLALEQEKHGAERRFVTKEQRDEIDRWDAAQKDAQRELRKVKKELRSGIDSLGTKLKVINICLMPLLVVLFGLVRGLVRKFR